MTQPNYSPLTSVVCTCEYSECVSSVDLYSLKVFLMYIDTILS